MRASWKHRRHFPTVVSEHPSRGRSPGWGLPPPPAGRSQLAAPAAGATPGSSTEGPWDLATSPVALMPHWPEFSCSQVPEWHQVEGVEPLRHNTAGSPP